MLTSLYFGVNTKGLANRIVSGFSKRLFTQIKGEPTYRDDTKKVNLRGEFIKGNYNDLPNLIFFPEACDSVQNWRNFFTNPENRVSRFFKPFFEPFQFFFDYSQYNNSYKQNDGGVKQQFLDYRNVYLLYPRNFGTSDRHPSFDMTEMTDDVSRFMYENRISTATFGGHGLGGKLALAFGCYNAERTTGVFNIDSAPLDHRHHEAFTEFKDYISKLAQINLRRTHLKDLENTLKTDIGCPKWRSLFFKSLNSDPKTGELSWGFEAEYLNKNLTFNKADSIANWAMRYGIYTGRVCFMFPEYSRWVFLNTNTLPILKVCAHAKGYGQDIFSIQGDDNPLNHWIYEFPDLSFTMSRQLLKFITMYDGVHVLLKDRSEVGKYFIPDRMNSRNDKDWYYSDYTPAHLHHNWRFSNIYEEANKAEATVAAAATAAAPKTTPAPPKK